MSVCTQSDSYICIYGSDIYYSWQTLIPSIMATCMLYKALGIASVHMNLHEVVDIYSIFHTWDGSIFKTYCNSDQMRVHT